MLDEAHGPLSNRVVSKTMKLGGVNIVVWGCMSLEGVGELTRIEGKMNSEHYQDILKDNFNMSNVWEKRRKGGCCNMIMAQNIPTC